MSTPTLKMDGDVAKRFLEVVVPDVGFQVLATLPNVQMRGTVYSAGKHGTAVRDLLQYDGQGMLYGWVSLNGTTLQPGEPGHNKNTTVPSRRWLFVDLDPVRQVPQSENPDVDATKVPSTDAELAAARDLATQVRRALTADGWPEPVQAMSGNGHHLLYRIDLPTDDGGLVRRVLLGLSQRFSTDQVRLDAVNHDAARNIKVAGTVSRKGPHTAERPHRLSMLVNVPDACVPVPRDLLEGAAVPEMPKRELAVARPVAAPVHRPVPGTGLPLPWDVKGPNRAAAFRQWLESRGGQVQVEKRTHDATYLCLARCLVYPDIHANGPNSTEIALQVSDDGRLAYINKHDRALERTGGAGLTWHDLRAAIDPKREMLVGAVRTTFGWQPPAAPPHSGTDGRATRALELVVLSGLLQLVPDDAEQAVALEDARRAAASGGWLQRDLLARVQEALSGLGDGAATPALLETHGIDPDVAAELFRAQVRPQQVSAAAAELERQDTDAAAERGVARVRQMLEQDDVPAAERLQRAAAEATQAASTLTAADVQVGAAVWRAAFAEIQAQHGRALQGLGTGLSWFDDGTDGLRGLSLLAAEPGAGKTNLALFLQWHLLKHEPDACCVFVSGELSDLAVKRRLWAMAAGLPVAFVAKGGPATLLCKSAADRARGVDDMTAQAQRLLREAADELEQLGHRYHVHDVRGVAPDQLTAEQLVLVSQTVQRRSGCRQVFVVLDSLQAIGTRLALPRAHSEVDRENHVMAAVARVQAGLGQPVLCISEQNKEGMGSTTMKSVRGSGRNIYQPDYVGLLYQPKQPELSSGYVADDAADLDGVADVVLEVVKARDGGRKGKTDLVHLYRYGHFKPAAADFDLMAAGQQGRKGKP